MGRQKVYLRARSYVQDWQFANLVPTAFAHQLVPRVAARLIEERSLAEQNARAEMNQLAGFPREFIAPILNAITKG